MFSVEIPSAREKTEGQLIKRLAMKVVDVVGIYICEQKTQ